MRKYWGLFLLSFISFNLFSQQSDYKHHYIVKVGDYAPDFAAKLSDGTTFKLSDQLGKVVMLQFTASWCGVCREEMPYIEKEIWQPLKEKDFVLIGVDYKESTAKTIYFSNQMKITYPLAIDSTGDIFHLFSLKGAGVTRNVIIDKTGRIIQLTRLFDRPEFEAMKKVIFHAVDKE